METNHEKNGRILVVDDDPEMRLFIKEQLTLRGYIVELASSAGEAINRLMERRYGLAIMDVRMPLMDGVTCLSQCLALDPDLPIIMISGEASAQESLCALNLGAISFMEKPLKMDVLLRLIEKTLGKRLLDNIARQYQNAPETRTLEMLTDSIRPISRVCGADVGVVIRKRSEGHCEIVASTAPTNLPSEDELESEAEHPANDPHFIMRTLPQKDNTQLIVRLKRNAVHTPFAQEDQTELDNALRRLRLSAAA